MSREPGWAPLPAAFDAVAARLLADCPALGNDEVAAVALAALRDDADGEISGWIDDGELVAVYGLRQAGLSYHLCWLAAAPAWRNQRYGRSALVDALRLCGRKPMTVEADEALQGWFASIGFRTVGRQPLPGGGFRYRMGWYAPRLPRES